MILKEKQFAPQNDPRLAEGDAAEKQMAYYLKRAFGAAKDVWVINDLRIEHENEAAQIDHLLVSEWGLFIIESKSVTTSVHINTHGEWAREYKNSEQGMPSPILQAEAQGHLLKQLLQANAGELLGTVVGLQKRFGYCPVRVYVAISDKGVIRREIDLPQVMKADAVAPSIKAWLKSCSVVKGLFSLSLEQKPGEWKMTKGEAEAVAIFLAYRHAPLSAPTFCAEKRGDKPASAAVLVEPIQEGQICPECGQHRLVRKTITRGGATTRDFLACADYPKICKGIYPLPVTNQVAPLQATLNTKPHAKLLNAQYRPGDACPLCKNGTLKERKGKTIFLGCSNYGKRPQCTFKDYSYKAQTS